jgi:hypothetical protein
MKTKKMVQSVWEQVLEDKEYLKGLLTEIETEIEATVTQEEFQKESSSSETDKM